jgi:hypothetical protein
MSTGKAGCGDRPHWLFRPLFRFQGARPEGAQSLWTGQNSVHPEVRQPANNFAGDNFDYRSSFRMWKPPQERRATLTSGPDQRNSAAQEAHTYRNQGVDLPSAAQPPRGGPSKIAALGIQCTSTPGDERSVSTTSVRWLWSNGSD